MSAVKLHRVADGPADGPVVVFGGSLGSDLRMWEPQVAPLVERSFRVVRYDTRGHGASPVPPGPYELEDLGADVLALLDELGVERAHLVGHSLGGAVVAAMAKAVPDRVASLTLLAPAGYTAEVDAAYLRGFAAATTRRELKPLLGRLFADPSQVTRQLVDDLLRYKRLDGVDKALSALLGTLLDGDRQAIDTPVLLNGVKVPVTVVWGGADRILPPPDGVGARVDAGHMLHMEAANDVVRALRGALTGVEE